MASSAGKQSQASKMVSVQISAVELELLEEGHPAGRLVFQIRKDDPDAGGANADAATSPPTSPISLPSPISPVSSPPAGSPKIGGV
ncbi:hypothetical protein ID866_2451 [Astraeus odoratus]|nr:hypothetical protein ID866_2451 [Astraeus odoratus]